MVEEDALIAKRIRYLRDETDFIECLFDNLTGFGIIAADFDGNIIAFNKGATQIFGYPAEDVIGKMRFEILFLGDAGEFDQVEEITNEMQKSGRYDFKGDLKRNGGEGFPSKAVFTLTRNRKNQPIGFIGIVEDITKDIEREIAEERVSELENEINSFKKMIFMSSSPATAASYGTGLLKDTVPDLFSNLVLDYSNILDKFLEKKNYEDDVDVSKELQKYSETLGSLKASARDIIDIHNSTINSLSKSGTYQKTKEYTNEGRFVLIELLGYLAMFYRKYSQVPSVSSKDERGYK